MTLTFCWYIKLHYTSRCELITSKNKINHQHTWESHFQNISTQLFRELITECASVYVFHRSHAIKILSKINMTVWRHWYCESLCCFNCNSSFFLQPEFNIHINRARIPISVNIMLFLSRDFSFVSSEKQITRSHNFIAPGKIISFSVKYVKMD